MAARRFRYRGNAGGYSLDSIQLGMADASGTPSNFMVMLYTAYIGGATIPGSSLGTLDGSLNPTTAGIYTFTTASNLMLSPNTIYFIVLTAGTTVANGAYEWNYENTSSYNPSDNWGGGVSSIPVTAHRGMSRVHHSIIPNLPSTPPPFPNRAFWVCWAWAVWPSSGIAGDFAENFLNLIAAQSALTNTLVDGAIMATNKLWR